MNNLKAVLLFTVHQVLIKLKIKSNQVSATLSIQI